ncbi:DegT/DnrJ/EryC1/StrS family aminotransferase [Sphingomonas lenta]|uniref:Aminotransferase DegT n=1 Tax=Sphingomonas lenta TaxID=1141887 RepID=A0A2A2SF47_9SPHN|nr:DegT/DnrJ/EryC1/StrS family aminotransferase [Sphingomonas lenta]PAX07822.1 aminotransferase DegT [Sphingomonas lenta]
MTPLPLIAPNPPRLSELGPDLRRVEASGVFSNNGPEVRAFEAEATERLFGGRGACLAVANATLGLMIAIRDAAGARPRPESLALVPALTFAATAHAAQWAGLTPLVCDIDPDDWSACPRDEERLLHAYAGRVSVVVPYATFGNAIDLDRYRWFSKRFGVGVVVDAAASLGTLDEAGVGFGADAPFPVVFSMHATKPFSVAEGGLVHSGDVQLIERLRRMASFGFGEPRSATGPGVNAKLPEVIAVMARAKLAGFDAACAHRAALEQAYRGSLAGFGLQRVAGLRRASQFMPVMLPDRVAERRDAIAAALEAQGIGVGRYFSPHLGQQPWFRDSALIEPTPVADAVGGRLLSLPITDAMTVEDARRAAAALAAACGRLGRTTPATVRAAPPIASALIAGGGPAGTALLTAASKSGRLEALSQGLVLVERSAGLGQGRLARYAINSDSTAQTFLTAVRGNPHPELASLADHPAAHAVERHADGLGVPLAEVGPLLAATGERLGGIVRGQGGEVLTGHEVVSATRAGDLWRVALRRVTDGAGSERLARNLVIATGGHQPLDRLATQQVAGAPLLELADGRLLQSDEVLSSGGLQHVAALLQNKRAPRIAVIGGSTSALTAVALLLRSRPGLALGAGAVTLLHRRPLRPFYHSVEAAHAEGYTDFTDRDVCPVSGFVYRLAGFRLEARQLLLRMLEVDGRAADPRVRLHRIGGDEDEDARAIVRGADLVIAALGYRPRVLPLLDEAGMGLPLAADRDRPMVDRHCRVLGADGAAVPGVYGIGLAAGFVPWGKLGGEASFSGQANGLWLWQNDVGAMIVDQLLEPALRAVA